MAGNQTDPKSSYILILVYRESIYVPPVDVLRVYSKFLETLCILIFFSQLHNKCLNLIIKVSLMLKLAAYIETVTELGLGVHLWC